MKVIDLHAHVHRDYERKIYLVEEQLEDMEKNKITLRMISALQGKSIHDQNHFILNFYRQIFSFCLSESFRYSNLCISLYCGL